MQASLSQVRLPEACFTGPTCRLASKWRGMVLDSFWIAFVLSRGPPQRLMAGSKDLLRRRTMHSRLAITDADALHTRTHVCYTDALTFARSATLERFQASIRTTAAPSMLHHQ
jgi:hypothetical protein